MPCDVLAKGGRRSWIPDSADDIDIALWLWQRSGIYLLSTVRPERFETFPSSHRLAAGRHGRMNVFTMKVITSSVGDCPSGYIRTF